MAGFDRDFVQTVRDSIDILDIAGDLTRLKRNGKRYMGLCPFHKEKSPSFSIDADQGLFYCFGCGAGGDAIRLYMQSSGDDFPAAIEALAERYGIPLPQRRGGEHRQGPDVRGILEAAERFFIDQLGRHDMPQHYLDQRRIHHGLRQRFGLGYAPQGWNNLLDALSRQNFRLEMLVAAGLAGHSERSGKPYDRFRHRLMFPIHTPTGRLVGFGGRTLGDDKAKYVNTAETEQFHKSRLLYGFHQAKRALRDSRQALLVEGYFDVIGAVASGVEQSVASMGTSLTPEQAKLLKRYVDEVVVAYDGDAAGEKAFQRALPILLAEGMTVRRARFPAGHDPDSLRVEQGPDAVTEVIERAEDAVLLEIDRLIPAAGDLSPARQTRAADEIAQILRPIRDEIVRRGYAQRASEHLGVPEGVFLRRLGPRLFAPAEKEAETEQIKGEEEAILRLLEEQRLPQPVPPEEIFDNEDCRNIFRVFNALYEEAGSYPAKAEVRKRLADEGLLLDRSARLMVEDPSSGGDLTDAFRPLLARWVKRRKIELARQTKIAQSSGDQALLARLLEEKSELLKHQHPGMDGKWY